MPGCIAIATESFVPRIATLGTYFTWPEGFEATIIRFRGEIL